MKIDSNEQVQQSRRSVDTLQSQLKQQQMQAQAAVGQAKVDAQRKVEALQEKVALEQKAQEAAISQVKATADTADHQRSFGHNGRRRREDRSGATKSQLEQPFQLETRYR